MMKKILHVFPSFSIGGTEMKTSIIINGTSSEFKHSVFVIDGSNRAEKLLDKSANIDYRNLNNEIPHKLLPKIKALKTIMKEYSPDLIVTYGWGASDALIANTIYSIAPLIHIEEGFLDEAPDKQILKRRIIRALFFRTAKFLCVPSDYLKGIAQKTWHLNDKKIRFIANGIDTDLFNVNGKSEKEGPLNIVIVASLHPVKNHSRMFRIFAEVSKKADVKLIVAGEGVDKEKLLTYAEELNIIDKIEMVGFVNEPHKLLEKCDIFCLTSNSEQMPMTILEAMAASLPVVATDVGDIKNMVSEKNREFVLPQHDEKLFAEKLIQIIHDKTLRESIGKENKNLCELKYTRSMMIENMKSLYEEAIGKV